MGPMEADDHEPAATRTTGLRNTFRRSRMVLQDNTQCFLRAIDEGLHIRVGYDWLVWSVLAVAVAFGGLR